MGEKKKQTKFNTRFLKAAEEWISENGLMQFGGAKLKDYCEAMGIHNVSHYNWLRDKPEYVIMIDNAIETYRHAHTQKLYNALMEQALGGFRENTTEDVDYKPNPQDPSKPMIAKKRTHREKRYVKGDTAAAIFLITNLDPKSFVNRQRTDMNMNIKQSDVKELSIDEAREFLSNLEREY